MSRLSSVYLMPIVCGLALSACALSPNYDRRFGDALNSGKLAQESAASTEADEGLNASARELRGAIDHHLKSTPTETNSASSLPKGDR